MSLRDIVSGAGLSLFAELALALFAVAFLLVTVTTFLRRNRDAFERARFIPLEDDPTPRGKEQAHE